jgi:hypothetical protein
MFVKRKSTASGRKCRSQLKLRNRIREFASINQVLHAAWPTIIPIDREVGERVWNQASCPLRTRQCMFNAQRVTAVLLPTHWFEKLLLSFLCCRYQWHKRCRVEQAVWMQNQPLFWVTGSRGFHSHFPSKNKGAVATTDDLVLFIFAYIRESASDMVKVKKLTGKHHWFPNHDTWISLWLVTCTLGKALEVETHSISGRRSRWWSCRWVVDGRDGRVLFRFRFMRWHQKFV